MTSAEWWPFHAERTVDRRESLLVIAAEAPDGRPVTITRLAPGADAELYERFRAAVRVAREYAGTSGLPPVAWQDLDTILPWMATYDDPRRLGADLIERAMEVGPSEFTSDDLPVRAVLGRDAEDPSGQWESHDGRRSTRHRGLVLGGIGGALALVLVVTSLAVGFSAARDSTEPSPTVHTTVPSWSPPTAAPSGTPTIATTGAPRPRPTLTQREPISVYGPTWKRGEDATVIAYSQLGWAFRTGKPMDCLIMNETATATKVTCLNLLSLADGPRRVTIVDRSCTKPTCSPQERKALERAPSGETVNWKKKDEHTKYRVDTFVHDRYQQRYFRFYLSHYYRDSKHRLRRHVSVYAEAPVGRPAKQIQKTVNDIRTQTG